MMYSNLFSIQARLFAALTISALLFSAFPAPFFVAEAQTPDADMIFGCTDPIANNYDPAATDDDSSCTYDPIPGCMDPVADNYDPAATEDDASCSYSGCTDPGANNYDPIATNDDDSCTYYTGRTMTFDLMKKFSGPVPEGMTADQFTFTITGLPDPITLTHRTDVEATAEVELGMGTYTITENGPDSFIPEDWTIQWSGAGCENKNGPDLFTTITIEERHLDWDNFGCWADNQWRPDDSGTSTDNDGSINGHKWNDLDGDGIWDSNEPGLAGWTITRTLGDGSVESTTTDENGEYWFTDLIPGSHLVCEEPQAGWIQTAPSSDNGCYEVTVSNSEILDINFGNQEDDNGGGGGQCVPESPAWAQAVEAVDQGETNSAGPITDPDRIDPDEVLGVADWSNGDETGFFSLGFGGSIIVSFGDDAYVTDEPGDDISIHEATNGSTYPEETALIEVSQDGSTWYSVGNASNLTDISTRVSYFDIASTGLSWIRYVRVTDTTDSSLHDPAADGFDLDAVDATKKACEAPEEPLQCIVEGYKYDETGAPLSGWVIGLSGEFYEYVGDSDGVFVEEAYTDTTDENGYYCVEEFRDGQDYIGSNYRVGEVMLDGWSFVEVTIDGSTTSAATVPDSFFDIWVDVDLPALGESLRVDFYNQADNNGDNGDTYRVEGYVWHDNNENTNWDGFDEESQQINEEDENAEESLAGWTVRITNGVTTLSTTTDATGFYYFEVPAGTWTITQQTESGWNLITPSSGNFIVTVPEVVTQSFAERIFALLIPTAHAAVVETFGLFNFGNNEDRGGGGRGPRSSDEDDSGGSVSGGGSADSPDGQVLGEQVSIVPLGAADTGAGGSAPMIPTPISFSLLSILSLMMLRLRRNA